MDEYTTLRNWKSQYCNNVIFLQINESMDSK